MGGRGPVGWVVLAVRWEIAMYVATWRWITRRYDVPPDGTGFRYVGAVSVLLWAFIGVSAVELVALHLILPWESVRLAADVVGIWGLLWMIGLAGSYHVYPHVVTDEVLRVRNGHAVDVQVPVASISRATRKERSLESNKSLQVHEENGRTVLSVVLASRTELDVRLSEPVTVVVRGVEHAVEEVRLVADDTRELARAINAAVGPVQAQ